MPVCIRRFSRLSHLSVIDIESVLSDPSLTTARVLTSFTQLTSSVTSTWTRIRLLEWVQGVDASNIHVTHAIQYLRVRSRCLLHTTHTLEGTLLFACAHADCV